MTTIEKKCKTCGKTIQYPRIYCDYCKRERKREQRHRKYLREIELGRITVYREREMSKRPEKVCKRCGIPIPRYKHAPIHCDNCKEIVLAEKKQRAADWAKRDYEKKKLLPREEKVRSKRFCIVCGSEITGRGYRSSYCVSCKHVRVLVINKEQRRNNPKQKEYQAISKAKRSARLSGLVKDLTAAQWNKTVSDFTGTCAYCGCATSKPDKEHFIPTILGGGFTASNILPSCGRCNYEKNGKHPLDYLVTKKGGLVKFFQLSNYLQERKTHA